MALDRQKSSGFPIMNRLLIHTQFLCTLPHRPPPIETTSFELLTEFGGIFVEEKGNETRFVAFVRIRGIVRKLWKRIFSQKLYNSFVFSQPRVFTGIER